MVSWLGQTIGKVRIDKNLARGGMAEIYLGTHLNLDRPVAVKMMHSHVEADPDLLERFQREAKAVAGLRHPNIVQVYDFDTHDGHPYIVMEYLKGPSLAVYLKGLHSSRARLSLLQISQLLKSLAAGIDYAHSRGIVHRDIKPANIILTNKNSDYPFDKPLPPDTECIITDFGLVRIANSASLTASGIVSGTPAYMSPEQAQGNPVDSRSDNYSLGIVLYEMLAGRPPFDGDSTLGVILKHISEPPPPIEDISPEIQTIVNKALEKLPEMRYQTARELLADFNNAVGMRAEAKTLHSLRPQTPLTAATTTRKPSPTRMNFAWIGAGILACVCLGVLAAGVFGISAASILQFGNRGEQTTTPAEHYTEGTTSEPGAPPLLIEGNSLGVLRFQENLNQVTVSATIPDPAEGFQYEAWLMDDVNEITTSIGILEKNASGQYTLTYLDPQSRNLLGIYNRMEISLEADPDSSPNPSVDILYSSAVPSDALTHIRHLLASFASTPNQVGMTIGLLQTSEHIQEMGHELEQAFENSDHKSMRASAEALINLIVGNQSGDYKDWDKDGEIHDPGDGYGLLLNGGQNGYIEGTITHAELAAQSGDATPGIIAHSEHVAISGRNVEEWATQLRDVAKRILESGQVTELDIRLVVSLAEQIHKGIDLDGSESVDPVSGEGSALTAYEHAVYMVDMQLLEGANQIPPPRRP